MKAAPSTVKTKVQDFLQTHHRWIPVSSFLGGFLYDIVTLGEIDDWLNLSQQIFFLLLILGFLILETREKEGHSVPRWVPAKLWQYRDIVIHFSLGALLSAYTLFFFKSASISTSLFFLLVMMVLMVLNELPQVQKSGLGVRLILFFVCSTSFCILTVPLLVGKVGIWAFIFSLVVAYALHFGVFRLYRLRTSWDLPIQKSVLRPGLIVPAVFLGAYLLKLIPPVPFAVKYMGIFHQVEKVGEEYRLVSTRPAWRFWENGDQTFIAAEGDRIFCFVRLFSPGGVNDRVYVRWFFKDSRQGWIPSDRIPLEIVGGRREGFRGFTYKSNYQEGDWRVSVETSDGREIGRIGLKVIRAS